MQNNLLTLIRHYSFHRGANYDKAYNLLEANRNNLLTFTKSFICEWSQEAKDHWEKEFSPKEWSPEDIINLGMFSIENIFPWNGTFQMKDSKEELSLEGLSNIALAVYCLMLLQIGHKYFIGGELSLEGM